MPVALRMTFCARLLKQRSTLGQDRNIPDTVGYATPGEIYDRFRMLQERVPNIGKAVVSTALSR